MSTDFEHLYWMETSIPRHILPLIVVGQFCCTSLWFAGNGIAQELGDAFGMDESIGPITTSVQLGFILGTLIFAMLKIADRFSPSRVFMICAFLGAMANLLIALSASSIEMLLLRFMTGFFLAGIYPVGMKIASDYHQRGLGVALGFLVGALVLGTASPHLIKTFLSSQSWKMVLYGTSSLSVVGGILIGFFVPNGPFRRKSAGLDLSAFLRVFTFRKFRGAALGYFGHMWELYAFWAFLPTYIHLYCQSSVLGISVSFLTFSTIAVGSFGCVVGGYYSLIIGSEKVAFRALSVSLLCIISSPFALMLPIWLFVPFLMIWGLAVIIDSPQFSSSAAANAPPELTGTALTIMNSIGFLITIGSISLLNNLQIQPFIFYWLMPGPLLGLILFRLHSNTEKSV